MRRQLQLADDRQAEFAHLRQLRRIDGNARAHDDQVLTPEGQQSMAARLDGDAFFNERWDLLRQRFGAAHVGNRHLRALAPQKQRRRQPRLAQTDDQYFFPFDFHENSRAPACSLCHARSTLYRSLRVVSAKSANTSAPIQKRVITLDSDQPISSK